MVKKVLLVSGLCLSGMLSASNPEAVLRNSINNFQRLIEAIQETGKSDPSLPKIRSHCAYALGKKLDDAVCNKTFDQEQYLSYCRQIRDLNEKLDLLVSQQKNG